ncbi:helix-turn-helix transcriptional regulator [Paraburkholderia sp. BL10I2N1]|uniref:helix-turn-helix domain-containing protein n=1 Tax=Paraburkholderia sp. BL10I2N1 TaxID=1938796 RepID=UPI00105C8F01|nr:helix-turn-helix transcriptional regulator [Paraburkholderia sp. BL10I2N1]TDN67154.1 Xre family transcriptional regulator [Paraburkholderia sp. BL10I2N1]
MTRSTANPSVFTRRLKQARLRSGLTQEQLGIRAGIDEFSASPRINQYEKGVHTPDFSTSQRIAGALQIPTSFLYEEDDLLARIIEAAGKLTKQRKEALLSAAEALAQNKN